MRHKKSLFSDDLESRQIRRAAGEVCQILQDGIAEVVLQHFTDASETMKDRIANELVVMVASYLADADLTRDDDMRHVVPPAERLRWLDYNEWSDELHHEQARREEWRAKLRGE